MSSEKCIYKETSPEVQGFRRTVNQRMSKTAPKCIQRKRVMMGNDVIFIHLYRSDTKE
jgi:hypothetical protein